MSDFFGKKCSLLSRFGFPTPRSVPTELEEVMSILQNIDEIARQKMILEDLNMTFQNNEEEQDAYNYIMNSKDELKNPGRDLLRSNQFHFIGRPGGMGKSVLFRKFPASCHSIGLLIAIFEATSLAALLFDGAVTPHSFFGYTVEDEEDVDDLNPTECKVKIERADLFHEVSDIFWNEYISNDCKLMGAVLKQFKCLY